MRTSTALSPLVRLKNWPRQRLRSRAFLTQPCSRDAGAPIPGGRVFVYAGLAYRRPGRLRASAATVRPDLLDQPTCCQLCSGRRRPPPVICREVVEFESCVDSGCAWCGPPKLSYLLYRAQPAFQYLESRFRCRERNREKCWTVEEVRTSRVFFAAVVCVDLPSLAPCPRNEGVTAVRGTGNRRSKTVIVRRDW